MNNIKYWILIILLLTGCKSGGGGSAEDVSLKPSQPKVDYGKTEYLIAGQSNGGRNCKWSYFENLIQSNAHNISITAQTIDQLIQNHEPVTSKGIKAIVFIHGERDAWAETPPDEYVDKVEIYRQMISADVKRDLPLFISTIGYNENRPKKHYDLLRNAVLNYPHNKWHIAYNDARYFSEWGMLWDHVHFNWKGCNQIMEAFYNAVSTQGAIE